MLSLSSEVAPQLGLAELDAACRARGLDGEEVVLAAGEDLDAVVERIRSSGARVVALRASRIDDAPALARCSAALDAPVSVPLASLDRDCLPSVGSAFVHAGGRLLLGHRTNLDEAIEVFALVRSLGATRALGLAWELHPASDSLDEASAILLATRDLLGVVRLHGGGPEQRDQDGRGVGPLIAELALSGFAGPIILCPTGPETLPRWATWLRSHGSSGCGHAVSTRAIELDVRDVEPRHRFDTIIGAYHLLVPGMTLHLTVDHDPVCMYYTLEATEPERSFSFQVVENGPDVWRADVTKL
ncbi:MAG: DUF2249 domain-containing protein [Kofleriaceae bacterium]|nr:DUF2249 domain-containing protein [Kofleriaceae bacterium]